MYSLICTPSLDVNPVQMFEALHFHILCRLITKNQASSFPGDVHYAYSSRPGRQALLGSSTCCTSPLFRIGQRLRIKQYVMLFTSLPTHALFELEGIEFYSLFIVSSISRIKHAPSVAPCILLTWDELVEKEKVRLAAKAFCASDAYMPKFFHARSRLISICCNNICFEVFSQPSKAFSNSYKTPNSFAID